MPNPNPATMCRTKAEQAQLIAGLLRWQYRVMFGPRREFESDKTVEAIEWMIGEIVEGRL